jgi:glycosyltransferase involved in cell wall biosynthesis
MLREDSAGLRDGAPSICFVAPAGASLDGPICRHVLHTAGTLVQSGWDVHTLWCGAGDDAAHALCELHGIEAVWLDDISLPHAATLDGPCLFPALHNSDRVLRVLRRLHEQHRFDAIEFPEREALGFRSIQAKQTGQAFDGVSLIVTLHGPSLALRHAHQQWLDESDDLALDYAERYALEHADRQQTVQPENLAEAERLGWHVGIAASTVPAGQGELIASYGQLPERDGAAQADRRFPLVTACVPYYNLGAYLEEALASLAHQTYPNMEVIVINDGSTDAHALETLDRSRARFSQFRFLDQPNAGIGATRNRGLQEARGEYFLPVDADNVAHPDMVRRFVAGMERNADIAALTCYFLAFRKSADLAAGRFAYAYKPTGGPRVLGCLQNVYGDGNAMFRTEALRSVGGFETDRDTSFEDWEVFVKLVNAARRVEVLPDFLFYYRQRDDGFSRATNGYANHQRVLRQFVEIEHLPTQERQILWNLLAGMQQRIAALENDRQALAAMLRSRRHRAVESLRNWWRAATQTMRKATRLRLARASR